jgi:hypothetical protein
MMELILSTKMLRSPQATWHCGPDHEIDSLSDEISHDSSDINLKIMLMIKKW